MAEVRQVTPGEMQTIAVMMERAGIPIHVWLPIMHLESGGNVLAHNPRGEDSRGLFQINLDTAPAPVRALDLFNPVVNAAAILLPDWLGHRDRKKRMQGKAHDPAEQAAYMYRHGIRPRWTAGLETEVRRLATVGLPDLMRQYGLSEGEPAGEERLGTPITWDERLERYQEIMEDVAEIPLPPQDDKTPGWLPNPFERLWWEISRVWRAGWLRVLILVGGGGVLVLSFVLLLFGDVLSFKPQALLGTATGGAIEVKEEE